MADGVRRRERRGKGGVGAVVSRLAPALTLAALGLTGCAAASEDGDGGSEGFGSLPPGSRWLGGQTGSLTPTCGLAPVVRLQGVPESSGIVVYTGACTEPLPQEVALFDAQGNAVPVQTQPLDTGAVLITPLAGLDPGSYTLGGLPPAVDDQDGGMDDDGDGGVEVPDASVATMPPPSGGETVVVVAASAQPTRLGELRQLHTCSAQLELRLDPAVLPYVPLLALDLRVDLGPPQRIVSFGTLVVQDGVAQVAVPLTRLESGVSPTVSLQGVLAGGRLLEPVQLALECRSGPSAPAYTSGSASDEGGCSATGIGSRSPPRVTALLALLALARLRRRRRSRPPD